MTTTLLKPPSLKSFKFPTTQRKTVSLGVPKPKILNSILPNSDWMKAFPVNRSHFHFNKKLAYASSYRNS